MEGSHRVIGCVPERLSRVEWLSRIDPDTPKDLGIDSISQDRFHLWGISVILTCTPSIWTQHFIKSSMITCNRIKSIKLLGGSLTSFTQWVFLSKTVSGHRVDFTEYFLGLTLSCSVTVTVSLFSSPIMEKYILPTQPTRKLMFAARGACN